MSSLLNLEAIRAEKARRVAARDTRTLAEKAMDRRNSLITYVEGSYTGYQTGWVHRDICDHLERFSDDVAKGLSPRLMLLVPPRHGKSMIASERFPVWHLGRYPQHEIALASYGDSLSGKFSKRARELVKTEYTQDTFPDLRLDQSSQSAKEWNTTAGGGYKATGIGGSLTGFGANILIIDDPIKNHEEARSQAKRDNDEEWYQSTAYTRLMPGGGVLIILTRWHEDDLAGRLIKKMKDGEGDKWEIVCYPAIATDDEEHRKKGEALHPERYSLNDLNRIKKNVGSSVFESLYQQNPSAPEGEMFKRADFARYDRLPPKFDELIFSWDLRFGARADKGSFVVGQVWGRLGANRYLVHESRDRWSFTDSKREFLKLVTLYPHATVKLVENKANGSALEDDLKSSVPGIRLWEPEGDKIQRAEAAQGVVESHNVFIPNEKVYPWVEDWLVEVCAFPKAANDDRVDAFTQAMAYFKSKEVILNKYRALT